MKNALFTCGLAFCAVLMMPSLFSCASIGGSKAVFSDVTEINWALSEIRSGKSTVAIDRQKYEADNMGNFFTITFQGDRVNGVAAPNRYFGPFTQSEDKNLSFGNLASTLMAAFREPAELNEHEYMTYLSKVTRWDLKKGKLELYTSNSSGAETVLVYTQQ